ncbi:zinc finger protein GLI1-like isoform X2 [Watersipora subatra]|uniref:zinc finger protein GLI1-like isoform X2 n=1 Tax=Watersipora subatra TaxID=2589382 RepID=UPI00355B7111
MAVFMVNGCKFRNCNLVFETLGELIQHIEEAHILDVERDDSDHPQSVAMSKILRFYGGAKPKKSLLAIASSKKNRPRTNSVMSTSASIRSLTPTSSEYDFDDDDGLDSYGALDSLSEAEFKGSTTANEQQWAHQLILRMVSSKAEDEEKPFVCPMKGCKKRYKNINGVKYHARNGHRREARLAKAILKCFCGKSFDSTKQLEAHTEMEHSLASYGIPDASLTSLDPKLSVTVKDEPSALRESSAPSLSIIHPITISGGMLFAPGTARALKTVNKGDILVAHKISASSIVGSNKQSVASLVSTSSSLVTPPNTPQKRSSNLSLTTSTKVLSSFGGQSTMLNEQQQKAINERVAQALAAAKKAMADDDANKASSSATVTTVNPQRAMIVKRQPST